MYSGDTREISSSDVVHEAKNKEQQVQNAAKNEEQQV
jgi:hypothetical protein